MRLAVAAVLAAGCIGCVAQELPPIGDLSAPRVSRAREHVQFSNEQQPVLAAERTAMLRLQFVVDDGFHINSHRPGGDLLVATELRPEPAVGVRLGTAVFPAGKPYHFEAAPGSETLDVYSGPFSVELPVTAAAGAHTLHATLRYQACDRAMCYPVRTLPVTVEFAAK